MKFEKMQLMIMTIVCNWAWVILWIVKSLCFIGIDKTAFEIRLLQIFSIKLVQLVSILNIFLILMLNQQNQHPLTQLNQL